MFMKKIHKIKNGNAKRKLKEFTNMSTEIKFLPIGKDPSHKPMSDLSKKKRNDDPYYYFIFNFAYFEITNIQTISF